MRSALLTLAMAAMLSACSEQSPPLGPSASPVAAAVTIEQNEPLQDAIGRIVPGFGDTQVAAGLQTALLRVQKNETAAAAVAEQFLAQLERETTAFAADVDAIRLALAAAR